MNEDRGANHLEGQKVALDYVKHVTTLAVSVIVISAAFLEDFTHRAEWRQLMVLTFIGLLACVVLLTLAAIGVVTSARAADATPSAVINFTTAATALGLLFFLLGIGSLTAFVIFNIE